MSVTGDKIKENKSVQDYRKLDLISASDLRLFSIDRKRFYKEKVLKESRVEEYNKSAVVGSLSHLFCLNPQDFDKTYMMSICSEPPTGMVLIFTEALYRNSVAAMNEKGAVEAEFKDLVQRAYEESGFKITLEAALKKFNETGKAYYDELMESKSKGLIVVCLDDVGIANKIAEIIKADEFVGPLFQNVENCELQVEGFEVDGIEMKAMMDRLLVSHENQTIQLLDLKITFDNVNFRREYFLKKQAYIQAYIYWRALKSRKLDLGFDYSDYLIKNPIFVCADSGCYYKPIQYQMSPKAMENAYNGWTENGREYKGVKEIIEDLKWAKETGIWTMSKLAYDNKGILTLE